MEWRHLLAWFFGGAFLTNAIPHFVSGVMGKRFQSPFADPPGQGLSAPMTNVLWGFINAVFGYLLVCRVGTFDWKSIPAAVALGSGTLLMGLYAAWHFGRFNSGPPPAQS
jgi:hypothetical protein